MTSPDVIVNDVFIDPQNPNRVLLATDRSGVLLSNDAARSFVSANDGFSARKVEALLVERGNSARIFAGVVNDKAYGGVFVSTNDGASWEQISNGLDGRDVFVLAQAPDGTVVAGTNQGIFALDTDAPGPHWIPRNTIQNTLVKAAIETHYGVRVNVEKRIADRQREMDGRVYALDLSGDTWLASIAGGLFTSRDHGASWQGGPVMGSGEYLSVAAHGSLLVASRADGMVLSRDDGQTWTPVDLPSMLTNIHCIAFSADGTLWVGTREGVYFTRDHLGRNWMWLHRLPLGDVDALYYDTSLGRLLVSSQSSDQIYALDPNSLNWKFAQTGYRIAKVRSEGSRLLAASLDNGVLIEPQPAEAKTGQK